MPKMERKVIVAIIKKALFIWTGLCLVVIGLIFSLVPLIPGIVPGIIGIVFLAKGSRTFRKHHYIKKFLGFIKSKLKNEKGMIKRLASFL